MNKIIDGKKIAAAVKLQVKNDVEALAAAGVQVGLAVIIVGENPASQVYVRNKKNDCAEVGIQSFEYALPESTTQQELLALIKKLNADESVSGILCQLPLPAHLDEKSVIEAISPEKDVDAFHPQNVGHIMIGDYTFLPCTPAGIMEMLHCEGISVAGKNCVVVGRSNIVGKPMAMMLLKADATVTVCHSKTQNLAQVTSQADILIVAIGKAKFITADMVKPGAVVIDVGMNRGADGKLCGDVDFDAVYEKVSHITPVPGGVGPMTRAILMKNTLASKK
ncbi:MAG: bifunctional methylenetetrahydrofolate dehydrogenase/methenyltetrahydrofolate cyclohydrolase FolD [Clostridiales bacterium]|nr:bifunctional methylenetetrahydrofolate dehydrogenase/methenyltetrahydrofolate cyclohydrolase FolD [Clostridiales bacterium]